MGHFTWRPKYVLSFPVALCRHKSALFQLRCYKAVRTADEVQILRERRGMLRYTYIVYLVTETLLTSGAIALKQFWKTTFLRLQYL